MLAFASKVSHGIFRAGRVDGWYTVVGREKDWGRIPAQEMVDERVSFQVRSGCISDIRVRFWRNVATAGYIPPFFWTRRALSNHLGSCQAFQQYVPSLVAFRPGYPKY